MLYNLYHIFLILILIISILIVIIGTILIISSLIIEKPIKHYNWWCYYTRVFDFKNDDDKK